jgi:hypothetical protein
MGGGSKQKTNQTQNTSFNNTSTYGYQPGAESEDINKLRDFKFSKDPGIGYAFSHAKQDLKDSYNNPIGGFYSPNMRDSQIRAGLATLGQQEAQANSEAGQQLQGAEYGKRATVAGLTAPRLVQQSSSGTGTGAQQGVTQQSPDILGALIGGAASGATA